MLWSILIAAIPERFHSVQPLLLSLLEHQSVARMPDVELLYLLDNRRRSVGAKRNDLLTSARGEYVAFIDDDDSVATDYVHRIYRAIVQTRKSPEPASVICFPQRCTIAPHGLIHECTYSLAYWKDRKPEERRQLAPSDKPNTLNWTGPPAHTMVWRRAVLEGIRFPEKMFGEDVDFVDQACEKAKAEVQIVGAPLYFYHFNEATSRTRG
jgi:glycosyltransferase involved in cell wall biosynthesis